METRMTVIAKIPQATTVTMQHPESMTWPEMMAMGEALVRTGFLPQHLKTGAQVAAVILTGRELGMPPMTAVRCLAIVKGKVVEAADSQLARFKGDGGRAAFSTLTATNAVLDLMHPNGDKHTEAFSIEDAKRAALSGDNWTKYPKAMLRSRCITAGLKSVGWQGAVGNYDPDEARAFADEPAAPAVVEAKPTKGPTPEQAEAVRDALKQLGITSGQRAYCNAIIEGPEGAAEYQQLVDELGVRAAKHRTAPTVLEQHEPEPPTAEEEVGQTRQSKSIEPPKESSRTQGDKIRDLLDKGGARETGARMRIVSEIVGRDVQALAALTEAEADLAIAALRGAKG